MHQLIFDTAGNLICHLLHKIEIMCDMEVMLLYLKYQGSMLKELIFCYLDFS